MIPQEKSAAVARALHEAFGVTEFEDIRRMTKGHTSALVFRIVVRGTAYLLRIIMRPNTIIGPERQFTCMRAAAEVGLAPRIWYTGVEDGISITDFIDEAPFPLDEALVRMPSTLRTLHVLPPFPRVESHFNTTCVFLLNKGPAVDGFFQKFQAANILTKSEIEELVARYRQLAAVYPHHEPDMVSSHNDLFKPDNTLFDGDRVWLVDWEAACLNDRYADLAVVANFVATSEAEEKIYLQQYFGQPPDEYQRARFFLMQQVAHIFYAMVFLSLGSSGEPLDRSERRPDFKAFHRSMWAGEINLADKLAKFSFGRVHWEQLLQNLRQTRFDEALRIVSDRHE
jgi:thiamine kinase-like enzyme